MQLCAPATMGCPKLSDERQYQTQTRLKVSQAAKAVGRARSTLNRDIANGKVSITRTGTGQPYIEIAELERAYGERYLNNPEITVRVISTNMTNITIEGGVNAPGIYALPGKTTLLGAIAMAKGIEPNIANPKRVAIFRKQQGNHLHRRGCCIRLSRDGRIEDED